MRTIKCVLFAIFFLGNALFAADKCNLSICALFKNEAPYLQEWIEYHQMVGVDHFYLYNNGSVDAFRRILSPYIKKKIVTLIQWPDNLGPSHQSDFAWSLSTQLSAYENALKWAALGKTKWLLFLDIDEFLVAPTGVKIPDILTKYDAFPGIVLSSEFYDASLRSTLPQRKFVIEAVEIMAPPPISPYRSVKKTILKPEMCSSFVWPPYECVFTHAAKPASIEKSLLHINRYENRMRFPTMDTVRKRLNLDPRLLSEEEKNQYLKAGYEIEDPDKATYRYLPDLYQKMGYN